MNVFLSRMYRAEKLPNTNLVFLITDAKATCLSCDPRPLRQAEQPCILSLVKIKHSYTSFFTFQPSIHHPYDRGALNSQYKDTHLRSLQWVPAEC